MSSVDQPGIHPGNKYWLSLDDPKGVYPENRYFLSVDGALSEDVKKASACGFAQGLAIGRKQRKR